MYVFYADSSAPWHNNHPHKVIYESLHVQTWTELSLLQDKLEYDAIHTCLVNWIDTYSPILSLTPDTMSPPTMEGSSFMGIAALAAACFRGLCEAHSTAQVSRGPKMGKVMLAHSCQWYAK